jgi:hypothetical protein
MDWGLYRYNFLPCGTLCSWSVSLTMSIISVVVDICSPEETL